ncbi:MAG: hypothetical protein N3B21_11510 [Clostridia bacterium]|nr:hypothetical protein [Clostridia bacterium]
MDVVRNFINISGLADENELAVSINNGQTIQYSETDTIYIPFNQPEISSIFQIMIKVELRSSRAINTPDGATVIFDGVKKLKIIYTEKGDTGKASFLNTEFPYNIYCRR